MKKPTSPSPRPVINLIGPEQVLAIIDGIEKSAFTVTMSEGESVIASLSAGGREVFTIDLTNLIITRKREGGGERIYKAKPPKFFTPSADLKLFDRLEEVIRMQYSIGGQEALNANLITRREVLVLIDAIRAMAFKIDRPKPDLAVLFFDGREVFRIDTTFKTIALIGLSKAAEVVYTFQEEPEHWFWAGTDRKLWRDLVDALVFFDATMHRVRMADYRAMFGNQMQKVIVGLAQAMDEAEADVRMLERVDRTNSGAALHPDVARLVQKDLDAGEDQAKEEP
jgi:hypothetical protein